MRFTAVLVLSFAAAPAVAGAPGDPFPSTGGVLPLNGRVVFFGDGFEETSFTRDGDALEFETLAVGLDRPDLAFIVDPGALVAGVDVAVEPQCAGCVSQVASFTVTDFVDETPPVFADGPAERTQVAAGGRGDRLDSHGIAADLPLVSDDGGPVLLRAESDEGTVEIGVASPSAPGVHMSFSPTPERRACFEVFALDVAGNETPFATPICADIGVGDGGCAQTSPSHALTLAVLALLVRRRRAR